MIDPNIERCVITGAVYGEVRETRANDVHARDQHCEAVTHIDENMGTNIDGPTFKRLLPSHIQLIIFIWADLLFNI